MRCQDLTRELASPTGALSPAEIAGHLAACPSCAEWSRRAARFERIWEATRPTEPSHDAMDALWARASTALDDRSAVAPATLRFEGPSRRRRWARVALVLAQAAAILVAALVLLRRDRPEPGPAVAVVPSTAKEPARPDLVVVADPTARADSSEPVTLDLVVGFDQTAVVRIGQAGEPRVEIQDQSHLFASSRMADVTPHDEYNEWEIIASR